MAVVHRVYARALYGAASEQGLVDAAQEELGDFVAAVRDVPELRALLRNPQVDPRARVAALEAITPGVHDIVRNFLRLLAEKSRIGEIEEIAREFERLVAAKQGQLSVELTTAHELSDDEARAIVDQIAKASGRRVEATRKVDPDLIGGVVLQAGSFRLDASVRGRLNRLRQELLTRS
jgi:F-type H+-transporting ATPase subunit delta